MAFCNSIANWLRIDEHLTTSGQPIEKDLAALAGSGVRHVINLAPHSHERALPDEEAKVRALGMAYVNIPVAFDAPTEQDFVRFRDQMEMASGEVVHVHCIVNARVSAFVYRYRRDVLAVDEATARRDLEQIWQPGGIWADFIGDRSAISLPHRPPKQRASD